jgi:polyisoprenoid-binding protein YceI
MFFCLALPAKARNDLPSYYVPPENMNAALQMTHQGSVLYALFQDSTARFSYESQTKSMKGLEFSLNLGSLVTHQRKSLADLLSPILFDAERFPEMSFKAPQSYSFTESKTMVDGTLTIRDISKPARFEATLSHYQGERDQQNNLLISLKTTVKRHDFGMAESTLPYGDDIILLLDMRAIQQ